MWHHPKYYEELRKKRKELESSLDPEATSNKPQASSTKLVQVPDASVKPRAKSIKLQATSNKLPDS